MTKCDTVEEPMISLTEICKGIVGCSIEIRRGIVHRGQAVSFRLVDVWVWKPELMQNEGLRGALRATFYVALGIRCTESEANGPVLEVHIEQRCEWDRSCRTFCAAVEMLQKTKKHCYGGVVRDIGDVAAVCNVSG